jgi:hypothetical protein
MRENNFDMWIHIPEPWNPFGKSGEVDPYQLGVETGYCIFTDRGGKKIERAVFEVYFDIRARELYDIIGEETAGMWEPGSRFAGIGKFVAERDPQRIAIDLAGISHSDYKKLSEEFGEKYAERMVSAEKLLADFRPSRGREDDFRSRTPAAWENMIRRDRFDFVLPQAMRNNNIDLWIQVIQSWDPVDLGATSGYAVFADPALRTTEIQSQPVHAKSASRRFIEAFMVQAVASCLLHSAAPVLPCQTVRFQPPVSSLPHEGTRQPVSAALRSGFRAAHPRAQSRTRARRPCHARPARVVMELE